MLFLREISIIGTVSSASHRANPKSIPEKVRRQFLDRCLVIIFCLARISVFRFAARCRVAWAGQWVEAVFSNAPMDIRRTCSTSLFTLWRSLTPTHTAPLRIRNPIVAYRLMVEPPPRQEDSLQDQVVRPTSRRPRPRLVSFRLKDCLFVLAESSRPSTRRLTLIKVAGDQICILDTRRVTY